MSRSPQTEHAHAPPAEVKPGAHRSHVAAIGAAAYVPAAHAMQLAAPAAEKEPASQTAQEPPTIGEALPASHGTHLVWGQGLG